MYRHLARCAGMAAVVLAAAWPISVYTAYGWEAALVHAPIAAAVYIMLLNALVMPLLGIHSARNDHPPRRYSGIALVAEICFVVHHQAGKFLQDRLPENVAAGSALAGAAAGGGGLYAGAGLDSPFCKQTEIKVQAAFHRPETPIQPTDVYILGAAFEHELPLQKQPALSNILNIQ